MTYEEDNFTIDWSDTEFKKYKHTVKIVNEGWFYKVHESGWHERDNYYIRSDTKNVASTNGVTGHCTCEAFKTAQPNENGDKKPCKHLIVCNERRLSWLESYNENAKVKMADDRRVKKKATCDHLKSVVDDPNSLFANMDFVEKIVEKKEIK